MPELTGRVGVHDQGAAGFSEPSVVTPCVRSLEGFWALSAQCRPAMGASLSSPLGCEAKGPRRQSNDRRLVGVLLEQPPLPDGQGEGCMALHGTVDALGTRHRHHSTAPSLDLSCHAPRQMPNCSCSAPRSIGLFKRVLTGAAIADGAQTRLLTPIPHWLRAPLFCATLIPVTGWK